MVLFDHVISVSYGTIAPEWNARRSIISSVIINIRLLSRASTSQLYPPNSIRSRVSPLGAGVAVGWGEGAGGVPGWVGVLGDGEAPGCGAGVGAGVDAGCWEAKCAGKTKFVKLSL